MERIPSYHPKGLQVIGQHKVLLEMGKGRRSRKVNIKNVNAYYETRERTGYLQPRQKNPNAIFFQDMQNFESSHSEQEVPIVQRVREELKEIKKFQDKDDSDLLVPLLLAAQQPCQPA